MSSVVSLTATASDGSRETFLRDSQEGARQLAAELEKEGRTVEIDGQLFLNHAGPDGLYLHQSSGACSVCVARAGCARCESPDAEYYSVKPTHYHSRQVDGIPGHAGIHDLLCYDCHRKDRLNVYGPTYGEVAA